MFQCDQSSLDMPHTFRSKVAPGIKDSRRISPIFKSRSQSRTELLAIRQCRHLSRPLVTQVKSCSGWLGSSRGPRCQKLLSTPQQRRLTACMACPMCTQSPAQRCCHVGQPRCCLASPTQAIHHHASRCSAGEIRSRVRVSKAASSRQSSEVARRMVATSWKRAESNLCARAARSCHEKDSEVYAR